ncbi:MAG: magnesium transporter [Bacteroidaceae bacterium]|nr:magnesium transporter [Bacteroidaceae bacterium]
MDEKYVNSVKEFIAHNDGENVRKIIWNMHPADIAELCEELDVDEARYIYQLLDNEKAADVLSEMDDDERKKLLEELDPEVIAKRFVDNMDTDDAVDLIRDLDEDKQEEVLSHINDIEQAGDIVDLLKYDKNTAGGIMGTEMVIVNENWSMPECLKEMRMQAEQMDDIYYVYVVDNDERLLGTFPLKMMISSPSISKVKHVMQRDPVSVRVDTPLDEVVQAIEKYDLVAIPVVDSIGRLVGQITVDDVMDQVREHSERDYQLASGISQDIETDDSVVQQTRARMPWLLIGILGGIGNSMILGNFDSTFAAHPEMALFIPLVGGTGGNVGTQSSAIVVQGLANSSLESKDMLKHVGKEAVVAAINATIISMLVYIYNFIVYGGTAPITYSVSLSLFAVVMFASIFGTIVPMTFDKLKIDPAIATGPFITIISDIMGMLIYMVITVMLT